MEKPKVCVLRTDGINCDRETAHAFNSVGGDAEIVHVNSLKKGYDPAAKRRISLHDYHILADPGGFSYGDYISAGKVFAEEIKQFLEEDMQKFIEDGKLVIGICNGFQVLVKSGFLPNLDGKMEQTATLTYNDSRNFECRWVRLVSPENRCVWTKGVKYLEIPVAHGEGRFDAPPEVVKELFEKGLVVYQYADADKKPTQEFPANPNDSVEAIAGICDPTGRIFGLMPHPERYNHPNNHHLASLQRVLSRSYVDRAAPGVQERLRLAGELPEKGKGLEIFRNGIEYVVENLLQ